MTPVVSFDDLATAIKQQLSGPLDEWVMPWHNGIVEPYNPISGHTYTGNNAVTLINSAASNGFKSEQWATLRAWAKKGIRLIKGSKATKIHVPIFNRATATKKTDRDSIRGFKSLNVFNGDQLAKYNENHPDMFSQFQNKLTIETFILKCKANINYHDGDAYYRCRPDDIFMPHKQNFLESKHAPVEHNFYATIIHELIHWTGHSKRLNRISLGSSVHEEYALEELVAELGTAMICSRFDNLIQPRTDHAAYLKYWLRGLDEDFYFGNAFKQAQEAVHYLYQLTNTDTQPLSYNPVKESVEDPVENESSLPLIEQAAPDVRQQYADFMNIQIPPQSFVRTIRIHTNCLKCSTEYNVTLMRYETMSVCPDCFTGNAHQLEW
jgi:antirestriction protein ArdC